MGTGGIVGGGSRSSELFSVLAVGLRGVWCVVAVCEEAVGFGLERHSQALMLWFADSDLCGYFCQAVVVSWLLLKGCSAQQAGLSLQRGPDGLFARFGIGRECPDYL